ncbi:hypothetical protein ACP70R_018803 [Stipagrostis hirtigluma subsp. patula]
MAPIGLLGDTPRRHRLQTPPLGGGISRDDSGLHFVVPSLCKENYRGRASVEPASALMQEEFKDVLPGRPKQCHPSEVAGSCTAPRGRYHRIKLVGLPREGAPLKVTTGRNMLGDFNLLLPPGMCTDSIICAYKAAYPLKESPVVRAPKEKKSLEEKNAIRGKRTAQRQRASLNHVETALRKYNRANNTRFALVEITEKCPFFEFGGGCYHYNFTAKTEKEDDSTQLFFAEIYYFPRNEDDVLLCCIVGEKDAGRCYACENYRPMMVHPSSGAYGGGNTTAINYPSEDSSSSDSG